MLSSNISVYIPSEENVAQGIDGRGGDNSPETIHRHRIPHALLRAVNGVEGSSASKPSLQLFYYDQHAM